MKEENGKEGKQKENDWKGSMERRNIMGGGKKRDNGREDGGKEEENGREIWELL